MVTFLKLLQPFTKKAVSVVQNLTCFPVGNVANTCTLLSEPTELVEPTLYIDDHWKVIENICVCYVDLKTKMTTTTGHSN